MDSSDIIQPLILIALVGMSAFFSSSETALTTVNKIRIRNLAEDGDSRAQKLLEIIENQNKLLSAILIGNNLVNIAATALATVLSVKWLSVFGRQALAPVVSTVALTFIVLLFGEITPKTMATVKAENLSLSIAGVIGAWMWLATPLIWIMGKLSRLLLLIMHVDPDQKTDTFTEEEIRSIVDASHEEGEIEREEREMINNVFDFGDTTAKDIMVPKVDVDFLDVHANYSEIMEIYKKTMFTRYPVYEETDDEVIGIINIKDIIFCSDDEAFDLRRLLRPVLYTHEQKKTADLFHEMRKKQMGLAIVLDEYGVTAGMVTMEDLIEEIVGDIYDEYDSKEESAHSVGKNEYEVQGATSLDDLSDELQLSERGLTLHSEIYDSVGGLVIELLDHLPQEGEEVYTEEGIRLRVDKVEKNHIDLIHIYLPEPKESESKAEPEEKDSTQ